MQQHAHTSSAAREQAGAGGVAAARPPVRCCVWLRGEVLQTTAADMLFVKMVQQCCIALGTFATARSACRGRTAAGCCGC